MAEFPDLGKHCSLNECGKLDFTPHLCKRCKLYFCGDHRLSHGCLDTEAKASVDVDEDSEQEPSSSPDLKPFACTEEGCNNRELVDIICSECGHNFCIRHRHVGDHACRTYEMVDGRLECIYSAPKDPKKEKISEEYLRVVEEDKRRRAAAIPPPPKKKTKVSDEVQKRQDRIAIMKIKGQPSDLDKKVLVPDRMYVFVKLYEPEERRLPTFVHKKWTVGRCVDHISKVFSIANSSSTPDFKKFRLYKNEEDTESLEMPDDIVKHFADMDTIFVKRDL